jgi:predicted MFS family arabinose efflux permease
MSGSGVGRHPTFDGFVSRRAAVDPTRRSGRVAVDNAVTHAGFALGAAPVGSLVDRFGFPAAAVTSAPSGGLALLLAAPRSPLTRRA